MTILQQVEIVVIVMPYFRSIATHTVWLLHKYEAHVKGFQICFRDLQAKNDATDNNFVTLWLHLKGNADLFSSCPSIWSFALSSYYLLCAINPIH